MEDNKNALLNGFATTLVAFVNMTYNSYNMLDSMWKVLITLLVSVVINFIIGTLATKKDWSENGIPESVKVRSPFKFELKEMVNNMISYVCIIMLMGFIATSMFENKSFTIIPFLGQKTLAEWTAILLVILECRTLIFDNLKTLGIDVIGKVKNIATTLWDVHKTVTNKKDS